MFVKKKKLMAKCRACGNESTLDSSHRAGAQLMKHLPKDMSEIDGDKKGTTATTQETKETESEKKDNG